MQARESSARPLSVYATAGDAQQAADWYALGRAALEGCAALDQGVKTEQRNCRMNRACKNRALAKYDKIKKELFDALTALCECAEHAIHEH